VALGALKGQAEPDGGGGRDAVDHGGEPELLDVDATLLVGHRVPVEAGGHLLRDRGAGRRSPAICSTVNRSKGMLALKGADDPVA